MTIKHFVLLKNDNGAGTPACNTFQEPDWSNLAALPSEIAETRKQVTCKNCRRTKVFRKKK